MSDPDAESLYHPVEDPLYAYLKDFQCHRLRDTYADFIAQPVYTSACDFFFDRLYSAEDTKDRDEAFKAIYDKARRVLGGDVIQSMTRLIELQELTLKLDKRLLLVLVDLGAPVHFDMPTYERAYRLSDNYPEREAQIELLEFTMRLTHSISHRLGIGMILSGLHAVSLVVGGTLMVDFLQEGYRAFVDIPDIEPLAATMVERERRRLDRIFGGP